MEPNAEAIESAMQLYSFVHGDKRSRARVLLDETNASVEQISALTGYSKGATRRLKSGLVR